MSTLSLPDYREIEWWWVSLPYATYVLGVRRNWVFACPPIALWMLGRPWPPTQEWLRRKGAIIESLGVIEQDGHHRRPDPPPFPSQQKQ